MWINFVYNEQKLSIEFEGDETLIDVATILNETYNIEKNLFYYINGTIISEKDYFVPLSEVPEIKGKNNVEIFLLIGGAQCDDESYISPFVRQNKYIVIGNNSEQQEIKVPNYSSKRTKSDKKAVPSECFEIEKNPQKHISESAKQEIEAQKGLNEVFGTIHQEQEQTNEIKVVLPSSDKNAQAPRKNSSQLSNPQSQNIISHKVKLPHEPQPNIVNPRIMPNGSADSIVHPIVHHPPLNPKKGITPARSTYGQDPKSLYPSKKIKVPKTPNHKSTNQPIISKPHTPTQSKVPSLYRKKNP